MHGLPEGLLHPWPWVPGPWPGFTVCSPAVPPFQGQEARLLLVRGQVRAAASWLRRPGERRHSLLQHGQQVDAAHHVHRGALGPGAAAACLGKREQTPQEGARGPPTHLRQAAPGKQGLGSGCLRGTWSPLEDLGLGPGPVHGHTHAHREVRQPAFPARLPPTCPHRQTVGNHKDL